MSAVIGALRRAGELLVEPAPSAPTTCVGPLEVFVTVLAAGAGATTVSHGLAHALERVCPVELSGAGSAGSVAAAPGTVVVRDTPPATAGRLCSRGHGRVLVAVADARREPALASLVCGLLAQRHERVLLVGNRVRDVEAWAERGALCVPDSRLGAWLLDRGRRPRGAMGAAFDAIAAEVQAAA